MFVSLQDSYIEATTLNVMVYGDGVFGKELVLDFSMRVGSSFWG